jgi:hypothetical protein
LLTLPNRDPGDVLNKAFMHAGVGGANFEFQNSTIFYSKQAEENMQVVIAAAEAARDAMVDIRFAYGKDANPNGTSAVSSELGIITRVILPRLPGRINRTGWQCSGPSGALD